MPQVLSVYIQNVIVFELKLTHIFDIFLTFPSRPLLIMMLPGNLKGIKQLHFVSVPVTASYLVFSQILRSACTLLFHPILRTMFPGRLQEKVHSLYPLAQICSILFKHSQSLSLQFEGTNVYNYKLIDTVTQCTTYNICTGRF